MVNPWPAHENPDRPGIDVTYDVNATAELFKLRIDGSLSFATQKSTALRVDTMLVTDTGELVIGTAANPIAAHATASIVFVDNGAVGHTAWDPTQLHRGLVSHGAVTMHGAEKADHLKVATTPLKGQTSLTLASEPTGWRVGDKIVLTGTHFRPDDVTITPDYARTIREAGTEDEVLTVKSISGRTVTFHEPLKFNHEAPAADLKASVANLTRNIILDSENPATHHRGHVMLMHEADVDIQNAGFYDLGRTDKSILLDDRTLTNDPTFPGRFDSVPADPATIDNMRGRYALHLHNQGGDPSEPAALVQGSVVWGSPGWGMVSHNSHADLKDNVSFDVYGAHYVAETGNETGSWTGNIAIKSGGRPLRGTHEVEKGLHDLGFEGSGFWLNGRIVELKDNIAAGMSEAGFFWFGLGDQLADIPADWLQHPATALGGLPMEGQLPAIPGFADNEIIASEIGLKYRRQGFMQHHDERSIFTDVVGWNVQMGISVTYTTNYLFENMRFYGAAISRETTGMDIKKNTESMTMRGVDFYDFDNGIAIDRTLDIFRERIDTTSPDRDDRQHFFIDTNFIRTTRKFAGDHRPQWDKTLANSAVSSQSLRLVIDDQSLFLPARPADGVREFEIRGTKFDSLGQVDFPAGNEHIWVTYADINQLLTTQGFHTLLDGRKVMVFEILFSDRATHAIDTQQLLVVLDREWNLPTAAKNLGLFKANPDIYVPQAVQNLVGIARPEDPTGTYGSAANDTILGTAGDDRLHGEAGDDVIEGEAGDDVIQGGIGADRLRGGAGQDAIAGGDGDDVLAGGDGDDVLGGGAGQDSLEGEAGNDELRGAAGTDTLEGGIGDDRLYGDAGGDRLYGGDGNDELRGGDDNDELYGQLNDDQLWGGTGTDLLDGGDGNDVLWGASGDDVLYGRAGTDELRGGDEKDRLSGGDGDDRLFGEFGDDLLLGENGNDRLEGNDGHDELYGQAQDDQLWGGTGDDLLDGGEGIDRLWGEVGNDVLHGRGGNDLLDGGDGNDRLYGQIGTDQLNGGLGNDTLDGGTENDLLDGGFGDDRLLGQGGADRLIGGAGNDVLEGGDGNDILEGGLGNDVLLGGPGSDLFIFAAGAGRDIVKAFVDGMDRLAFTGFGPAFDSLAEIRAAAVQLGPHLQITLPDPGAATMTMVTLEYMTLAKLDGGDFAYVIA